MKTVLDVFWQFFGLGWISFGGPAAHIGYFHKHFVERKQWISAEEYGHLVALSQMLPGPGSSQVGFALGLHHAGLAGGVAAFAGFTLPSFLLMTALVIWQSTLAGNGWLSGVILGLKLLAVVVVVDAVSGMAKNFTSSLKTQSIAVATCVTLLVFPAVGAQMLCLGVAAIIGAMWMSTTSEPSVEYSSRRSNRNSWNWLVLFVSLFVISLILPTVLAKHQVSEVHYYLGLFAQFYQSGSLVFGGGHVVLPLLQQGLEGSISNDQFLMGYAAAQGVPGPMFTLASFLGASLSSEQPWLGATVATLGIFLPGFLLILALKDRWQTLSGNSYVAGAFVGVNASVVGLLLAALYQPVFTSAVNDAISFSAVLLGFFALNRLKIPIFWLIVSFVGFGVLSSFI